MPPSDRVAAREHGRQFASQGGADGESIRPRGGAPLSSDGPVDEPRHPLPYGGCLVDRLAAAMPAGSATLSTYLERVYGGRKPPAARLSAWRWDDKDVLWPRLLESGVRERACTPPFGRAPLVPHLEAGSLRAGKAFVAISVLDNWAKAYDSTGLLWRFEPADACHGEPYDQGGRSGRRGEYAFRNGSLDIDAWVEVTHVQVTAGRGNSTFVANEREVLWMYRARGAGLWYRPGYIHSRDDFWTVVARGGGGGGGRPAKLPPSWPDEPPRGGTILEKMRAMRARGVQTVELLRRVADFVGSVNASGRCGPGAHTPFYSHELVGLHPRVCERGSTACPGLCLPPLSVLRFGWPEGAGGGAGGGAEDVHMGMCGAPGGCVNEHGKLLRCRSTTT